MLDRRQILAANRTAYQRMTAAGAELCKVISDEELRDPLAIVDPLGWLGGNLNRWRVLCLAAGGGRQSSLYAAAGADVTVVDLCPEMLAQDRAAAAERGFAVRCLETSMDDLSMLAVAEFDLVAHPVSTCYLPDIAVVYAQVARVLRPGGLYVSQHKSPVSLQCSAAPLGHGEPNGAGGYLVQHDYYRQSPVPPPKPGPVADRLREPGAIEFLHRWEQMIGGLCRAGFVIEDLVEPVHAKPDAVRGSFAHRANFIAPYVRIKARRRSPAAESPAPPRRLILTGG